MVSSLRNSLLIKTTIHLVSKFGNLRNIFDFTPLVFLFKIYSVPTSLKAKNNVHVRHSISLTLWLPAQPTACSVSLRGSQAMVGTTSQSFPGWCLSQWLWCFLVWSEQLCFRVWKEPGLTEKLCSPWYLLCFYFVPSTVCRRDGPGMNYANQGGYASFLRELTQELGRQDIGTGHYMGSIAETEGISWFLSLRRSLIRKMGFDQQLIGRRK